jgi:hypothetical protein
MNDYLSSSKFCFSYSGAISDDVKGDSELEAIKMRDEVTAVSTRSVLKTASIETFAHYIIGNPRCAHRLILHGLNPSGRTMAVG